MSQPGRHGRTLESGKLPHGASRRAALGFPGSAAGGSARVAYRRGRERHRCSGRNARRGGRSDHPHDVGRQRRLSVLVNANDVAVCGARPRWFLAVVLVPPGTSEGSVRDLFSRLHAALAEVGAALVGGHTEVTPAVTQPIVLGTMLGITERGAIVETAGLAPGDLLLQVRPVPIEGAAVLANEAAERLSDLDAETLAQARVALDDPGISVVEPALLATRARRERAARPDGGRPLDGSARDGRGGRGWHYGSTRMRCCGSSLASPCARLWAGTRGRRLLRGRCSPRFRRRPSQTPRRHSRKRGMRLPYWLRWSAGAASSPPTARRCLRESATRWPASSRPDAPSDWEVKIPGDGRRTSALVELLVSPLRRRLRRPLRRRRAAQLARVRALGWSLLRLVGARVLRARGGRDRIRGGGRTGNSRPVRLRLADHVLGLRRLVRRPHRHLRRRRAKARSRASAGACCSSTS